jgi:hypothetical protein
MRENGCANEAFNRTQNEDTIFRSKDWKKGREESVGPTDFGKKEKYALEDDEESV